MLRYIDAHCHLQNLSDLKQVFKSASNVGVCGFVCNATSPDDWNDLLKLTQTNNNVFGCIGVHPWYVNNLPVDWLNNLRKLLQNNQSLMIGEIGLDKKGPDILAQEDVFISQMQLAYEMHKVVHIHCVGAWERLVKILKDYPVKTVLHGFSGSAEILKRLLLSLSDVYFSFSSSVLDDRRRRLIDAIRQAPIDKILVESDEKSPNVIVDVANKISEIKSIASDKMADTIYNNTLRFLNNG